MRSMYAVALGAMLCLACTPASAFELDDVEVLSINNDIARVFLTDDADAICDKREEPSICRLEFDLADQRFNLARRLLIMAAIAHQGEQRKKWLAKALAHHDEGWRLYKLVYEENTREGDALSHTAAPEPP